LLIALAAAINIWIAAALIMNFRERARPTAILAPAAAAPPRRETPQPPAPAEPPKLARPDWVVARMPSLPAASRGANAPERITDAMDADCPFSRAVDGVLANLHEHFGDADTTSRLAIAPIRPRAGASTLARALAHAARDEGLRVLLADCSNASSSEGSGGTFEFKPAGEANEQSGFDLVLLDCGSLSTADYLINHLGSAEAVLAVDFADAPRESAVAAIESAGLGGCLVGVALTPPRAGAWRRAS
jgi:hypothetical protein